MYTLVFGHVLKKNLALHILDVSERAAHTAHDELNKCNKLKTVNSVEYEQMNEWAKMKMNNATAWSSQFSIQLDCHTTQTHSLHSIIKIIIFDVYLLVSSLVWTDDVTLPTDIAPHRRCRCNRHETRKTVWINRHQDRKMCAWHLICTDELPASITQYSYNLFKQTANCHVVTVLVFFRDFSHINRSQINMFCTHRWTSENARLSCM